MEHGGEQSLRSKGLLPALGVGAAVYFVTGVVSIGTLGLVGIGAGVGYGVGTWIADKYQQKQDEKNNQAGANMGQLPWAMQVSLQSWQTFLMGRSNGQQLTPAQVEQLFQEFAQLELGHAKNVSGFVHQAGGAQPQGPNVVPVMAAEV